MAIYDTEDPKVKRVRVYWKGRPIERRVRHDSGVAVTKKEAEAYEARLRTQLEAGEPVQFRVVPTFFAFCSEGGAYHQYAHSAGRFKKGTARNRKYQLRTLIEFFGDFKLNEIGAPEILAYQNWRSAGNEKEKRRSCKASTVNSDVQTLRAVLNYGRKVGFPVQSLGDVDDLPERGEKRAKAWTAEQVARLLDAAWKEDPRLFGIILVMVNTGMRKGETLALQWSMVDLDRRIIDLEGNEEWTPKDEEPREIPISDALLSWFETAPRTSRYVFPPSKKKKLKDGTQGGERYAYWPQDGFDAAVAAAKVPGSAHTCRHTYASHFLAQKPDLDLLRRILGHSTVRVTEKIYGHMLPGRLDAARNAVNFGGASTDIGGSYEGE